MLSFYVFIDEKKLKQITQLATFSEMPCYNQKGPLTRADCWTKNVNEHRRPPEEISFDDVSHIWI